MEQQKHYLKRSLSLLLSVIMIFSVFSGLNITVSAEDSLDYLSYEIIDGEVTITDCEKTITSVIIPSEIEGCPVTSIGDYAFYYCTSLTSVEIPDSITSIGYAAFCGCLSLTIVTIPNSVMNIVVDAFESCTSLTAIDVDEGNEFYSSIDGVLFSKDKRQLIIYPCGKGSAYNMPAGVTSIGDMAFYYCKNLTSISLPDSVNSIGDYAFCGCESLASVTIPNSATNIGQASFFGCESLASIVIPKSMKNIGDAAFSNCSSLNDVYYTGTKEQWEKINIGYFNEQLTTAAIHYNHMGHIHNYLNGVCDICGGWRGTKKEVDLKSATNVTGGVKISWSTIPGAKKYIIYRKTSSKAEWKRLYVTKTAASAYTDKTAKSGTKYYYTVKAVRDGEYSKYDNDGVSRTYLAVPKISSVSNKSSYVEIKWGKVTGASSYDVYRKVKGGSWAKLDSTKSTTFKDKTAKAGKVYEYKVRAKVGKSTTSEFSSVKKIVRLTTPKLTKVTATSGKVTFTFGKVTGAEKYYIYRKTGSGSYKKIATTTSTKYVDKSVKKGTTYTYTVKAVKSSYSSAYNSTGLKVKAK